MNRFTLPSSPADILHEAGFAREHRLLEDLIERLFERERAGATHAELMQILQDLELRTADHFRGEEAYMASVDYGGLSAHQRVHRQLLCEFARLRAAYAKTSGALPARLRGFLHNWLATHIQHGEVKQRGIAAMSRLRSEGG